jgi:hypothetical protein
MAKQSTVVATATKTANLRLIGGDETFSPATDCSENAAVCKYAVRPVENGPRFEINAKLDFTNCSREEIIAMAAKTAIIDLQRQFRVGYAGSKRDEAMNPATWAVVDVKKQIIDTTRAPKSADPVKTVRSALDKMTPEARKALLAELAAM